MVDFGLDAATAPLATPSISHPLRCYSLPPSPPYTNPHLRRAIPLPLLDGIVSSKNHQPGLMNSEKDGERRMLSMGIHGPANLLSPPYSARRRSLSLLTVDEKEEDWESASPLSAAVHSKRSEPVRSRWGESDDDFDEPEPPVLKVKDLDLGEESDDWDEPLFLNAPSALKPPDSLSLNLFGAVHSIDDEEPSFQSLAPPSSPTVRSSSLPDFGDEGIGGSDPRENNKPLFDPSDFDVFENGWDTITIDSTHSSLLSHESSQLSGFSPTDDSSTDFHDRLEPSLFQAPSSPSRRSIIELPSDDSSEPLLPEVLTRSRAPFIEEECTNELDQIFDHSRSSRNTFHCSHNHQRPDVPSEMIQTPFNIPLLLPSHATRVPPANSLLFAALEPEEIPLPDSPESPVLKIRGEYVVPPIMLEESRIRRLHQEMVKVEVEARRRETLLTEYIARLNTLQPPSPTVPVAIYLPAAQAEVESGCSGAGDDGLKLTQPGWQQSSSEASSSYFSDQASMSLDFLQARRKEMQNAITLRTAERRRRKLAKERIRELEALLQLKCSQLFPAHGADVKTSPTPSRGRKGRSGETAVLTASGYNLDFTQTHTKAVCLEGDALESHNFAGKKRRPDGMMQLVAKMVFRRRDTSRPLSGRTAPIVREYVPSGLSRTAYVDEGDDGNENGSDDEADDSDLS